MPEYYDKLPKERVRYHLIESCKKLFKFDRYAYSESVFNNEVELIVRKITSLYGPEVVKQWVEDCAAGIEPSAVRPRRTAVGG